MSAVAAERHYLYVRTSVRRTMQSYVEIQKRMCFEPTVIMFSVLYVRTKHVVRDVYVRVDNRTIIEYRSKSLFVHEIENLKKKIAPARI